MIIIKIWSEIVLDAYNYFSWVLKDNAINKVGYQPSLSLFNINGSMIEDLEDFKIFKEWTCVNNVDTKSLTSYAADSCTA